jgi:hypothetical protein
VSKSWHFDFTFLPKCNNTTLALSSFHSVYITFISPLSASSSLQTWLFFISLPMVCSYIQSMSSFHRQFLLAWPTLLLTCEMGDKQGIFLPSWICRRNQKWKNGNIPYIMIKKNPILKCGAICVSNIEAHNPWTILTWSKCRFISKVYTLPQ